MTVILGLDPGLAALGYGLIRTDDGHLSAIASGALKTKRRPELGVGRDLALRIGELAPAFADLVEVYRPNAAAIEEFRFYGKAVTSALQVANVVGMLREALRTRGVTTTEYSAREIKHAVAGDGNASKASIQAAVQRHLGLGRIPRPVHAADALAAAIAHAVKQPVILEKAGQR